MVSENPALIAKFHVILFSSRAILVAVLFSFSLFPSIHQWLNSFIHTYNIHLLLLLPSTIITTCRRHQMILNRLSLVSAELSDLPSYILSEQLGFPAQRLFQQLGFPAQRLFERTPGLSHGSPGLYGKPAPVGPISTAADTPVAPASGTRILSCGCSCSSTVARPPLGCDSVHIQPDRDFVFVWACSHARMITATRRLRTRSRVLALEHCCRPPLFLDSPSSSARQNRDLACLPRSRGGKRRRRRGPCSV